MTIETELPAVKVKALEWEVYPDDGTRMFEGQNEQRQYISRALPPIGPAIFIMTKDDVYSIEDREGIYGTENDAKMVAQADYERRILSALTLKDDPGDEGDVEDNQPRYTTKRLRDEIAKARAYARREALEEAAKAAETAQISGSLVRPGVAKAIRALIPGGAG